MRRARLASERGVARARAVARGFRPLRTAGELEPRVLLSGFGPFPNAPRNATAEIVSSLGVPMHARHARVAGCGLVAGRGRVVLPSGRRAHLSVMILPVVWEAAALLVVAEARAFRPSIILMSGVAAPAQPLMIERAASPVRSTSRDAWGVRHPRRVPFAAPTPLPLRFDVAEAAARVAIERETQRAPGLAEVLLGVAPGVARADNAYVCNATTHVVVSLLGRSARLLRSRGAPDGIAVPAARLGSGAECGFLHWPRDLAKDQIDACGRVLLEMVDALVAPRVTSAAARRGAGAG